VNRLRDSYLGQAWLILLLGAVFGALLAAVHLQLSPRIEDNIRAEIMREIPGLLLGGGAREGAAVTGLSVVELPSAAVALYRVSTGEVDGLEQDRILGWVARGQDHGYADVIELLVGLNADTSLITGIYVLNQKETPALGDGIVGVDFRRQFAGIPTDSPLTVGRSEAQAAGDPYAIQALTGATVSSRSVCKIVNDTVALVQREVAARSEGDHERP
jgi:Na+-translocating ferredoxin:NAD+ oxidoreductase subunit G